MEIRMETTEGLGRPAEVWLDGHPLTVCDGVSSPQTSCPSGPMQEVKFTYVSIEGFSWDQAAGGNPSRKKTLEAQRAWGYIGYGQVVQIMPVVIDFGLVRMEDANWTSDEKLVGRFVRIPIDRLEISRAEKPDWPEHLQ